MKSKGILFLSPFFYPEEISRGKYNTCLVKALVESKVHVDVVASYPFYPDWSPEKTELSLSGVEVYRGGLNVKYPRSQILKRLVLELWFLFHVTKYLFFKRKNINKVVVVFPPVLVMWAVNILLPKKVIKIGIVHDLQGVMARTSKSIVRVLISKLITKLEKYAFKNLDKIVCLSQSMSEELKNNYSVDGALIDICYPFVTLNDDRVKSNSLSEEFNSDYLHIVYSGALGEKQRPVELLALFKEISKIRQDVMCHIISSGPIFESLKNDFHDALLGNIKFRGLVHENELDELYSRSTIQIIPQAMGTGNGAFPSKLPNLLASGVPVYAICENGSELSELINKIEFCKSGGLWDIKLLSKEILIFLDEVKNLSHDDLKNAYKDELEKMFGVGKLVEIIANT
ncbi:MAG: glycosyltransferase [Gammaproteobacteria bacterium]|nr:glycosyltransferase [Gammaproteobacteria bacterium]